MQRGITLFVCVLLAGWAHADDAKPLPPIKPIARVLPPKGVDIGKEEREKLEVKLRDLTELMKYESKKFEDLRPDVEIYAKAVRWALDFDEFYDAKKDVAKAHAALDKARQRFEVLHAGQPEWLTQRGLVVRGYRSNIDDSVQPYGLHIPANLDLTKPVPLLVWLHGRGDKETDLHFIASREKSKGEFAPDWCITLHPYGRGTIGFKFAGEIDVLDAIESVKKRYKIDDDRIALAGFSMGGAGAWHIGAHYADQFCVVHAGAGFVETAKYQRLTPEQYPEWYVQKLWGWYDVPDYTRNLFNVPVIAYSGENDKQKQAADLMAQAFKAEGRELRHIIGPGVEHKYEAKAKEQVLKEIKAAVDKGRDRWPKEVHLQTRTLRYNRSYWAEIEQMNVQWDDARIDAQLRDRTIEVKTKNVVSFLLHPTDDLYWGGATYIVDGESIVIPSKRQSIAPSSERFAKVNGFWTSSKDKRNTGKVKQFQGSIDDAFMSPFVVIEPTGRSTNAKVQRWIEFELTHFKQRWRELFRGDVRAISTPLDFGSLDFKRFNYVVWGDPSSNSLYKALVDAQGESPIRWGESHIEIGGARFDASTHVPVFIRPSSWKDTKYIVLNSGPTFREGHDRTNSQQTPKLPDWAIISLDKDPDAFAPGEIKAAGFFDENWKVKAVEKK